MTRPPPIAFTDPELDLLLLGLALIEATAREEDDEEEDEAMGAAIASARKRIAAALPPEPAYRPQKAHAPMQRAILGALATETRLRLDYIDGKGSATTRRIWPVAFDGEMLAAWCEERRDFRHFRLDRMQGVEATGERMPQRRRVLRAALLARDEEDGW